MWSYLGPTSCGKWGSPSVFQGNPAEKEPVGRFEETSPCEFLGTRGATGAGLPFWLSQATILATASTRSPMDRESQGVLRAKGKEHYQALDQWLADLNPRPGPFL